MEKLVRNAVTYTPPPLEHLRRLENVASTDIAIAGIILRLFDLILGARDRVLFPDYDSALNDIEVLPTRCRAHARAVFAWGSKRRIILNELIRARHAVAFAIVRIRRHSPFGRRRIRIANKLKAKYPALKPDGRPRPENPQTLEILGEEIGRPVGPGAIRRISAFSPSQIEIRGHQNPCSASLTDRAVCIRRHADGYTIERITMVLSVARPAESKVISGVLEDFFETGTEGVVWSVYDEDEYGYDGLHTIDEGDHLTIFNQLGHRLWAGRIRCDRKSGWKRYLGNPRYGQPCALGRWIHWTQKGFKPDDWARFFIRPKRDRLRAILKKRSQQAIERS
jgi:hypothetical protein